MQDRNPLIELVMMIPAFGKVLFQGIWGILWPPNAYDVICNKMLTPKWKARIDGDFATLWVLRSDMNSVHNAQLRFSTIKKEFPDMDPTHVWRTGESANERIIIFVFGLVIMPTFWAYVSFMTWQNLLVSTILWIFLFIWSAWPAWHFARSWAEPRHILLLRIRHVEAYGNALDAQDKGDDSLMEAWAGDNAIRRRDGYAELSEIEMTLSNFQDEYIEGGYSTEFAAMTMDSDTLREYAKYDWEEGGLLNKIPMTFVLIFGILVVAAFLFWNTNQESGTPQLDPNAQERIADDSSSGINPFNSGEAQQEMRMPPGQ